MRRQFQEQQRHGDFYPAEAIARGLQGEVLVRLLLTPDGSVEAARVEESSGHRLLDDAALKAVRALRALPADAPRETLLPVIFRLR
ncbi:MAG: energy transducer TonB [Betaproteobacteria bacterium]|nr:energy transducer TonB [Betaproteobacteria bacterium]MCL2887193.1 energy transducer TonB [Betaproteobacteria bacterium]